MQSSLLKQLIYGILFAAIILGVGYLLYLGIFAGTPTCFDNRQNQGEKEIDCGGPCEACELQRLKPIQFSKISVLDLRDGRLSLVAEAKNPNVSYGAKNLVYVFSFYGKDGSVVSSLEKESFIYPGEVRTLIEPALNLDPGRVTRVGIEAKNISWKPVSEFQAPKSQIRDVKISDQGKDKVLISGLAFNENSFEAETVTVKAVIMNAFGLAAAASKTVLQDLKPFEERSFSVIVPIFDPKDAVLDRLKVSAEIKKR